MHVCAFVCVYVTHWKTPYTLSDAILPNTSVAHVVNGCNAYKGILHDAFATALRGVNKGCNYAQTFPCDARLVCHLS